MHITQHDRLVVESGSPLQQRSRQRAGCSNTLRYVSTSPKICGEALLVHAVCCVRFWPKLFSITVDELGLLLLWRPLTMPMAVTAAQAFSSATFARSSAWFRRRRNPLEFELRLMRAGLPCLVSSVAILTRSSSMLSTWSAE